MCVESKKGSNDGLNGGFLQRDELQLLIKWSKEEEDQRRKIKHQFHGGFVWTRPRDEKKKKNGVLGF